MVLSATLWYCLGNVTGWYIGQQSGFHRGVLLMADFVLLLKAKEDAIDTPINRPPSKYTDL